MLVVPVHQVFEVTTNSILSLLRHPVRSHRGQMLLENARRRLHSDAMK